MKKSIVERSAHRAGRARRLQAMARALMAPVLVTTVCIPGSNSDSAFAQDGPPPGPVGGCDPIAVPVGQLLMQSKGAAFEFGTFESPPIPADFFGPGSLPFEGRIEFKGVPVDPNQSTADTIIQRLDTAFVGGLGDSDTVDIELVALNLVSIQPITVVVGTDEQLWDVQVTVPALQPPGQMTITRTHPNGGIFDATLPVCPQFVFRRISDLHVENYLPCDLTPPLQLQVNGEPWVQAPLPNPEPSPSSCMYLPEGHLSIWRSLDPERPTFFCGCQGLGPVDCNLNGLPDQFDILSGTSPDWNNNGIPDECEMQIGLSQLTWMHNGIHVAPFSEFGQLHLTMIEPPAGAILWVNALVDGVWAIQNAPLIQVDDQGDIEEYSYDFKITDTPGVQVLNANVDIMITPNQQLAPPPGPGVPILVEEHFFHPSSTLPEPDLLPLQHVPDAAENIPNPAVPQTWQVVRRARVPGVDENLNHCVPGAAARSLAWMNQQYCLLFPPACDTAQEIYNILRDANHMKTTKAHGTYIASNTWDCTNIDATNGLKKFIQDKNLEKRLVVDCTVFNTNTHGKTPCDLFEDLKKGKDVIGYMGWTNPDGTRNGGHAITITGAVKCGTDVRIFYKDDVHGNDNQADNTADSGTKTARIVADNTVSTGYRFQGKGIDTNRWEGWVSICPKPLTIDDAIFKFLLIEAGILSLHDEPTEPRPGPDEIEDIVRNASEIKDNACALLAQVLELPAPTPELLDLVNCLKQDAVAFHALAEFLREEPHSINTIQEMLNLLQTSLEVKSIQIAQLLDCNGNGIDDTIDLLDGTSSDVNRNGIPDECECLGDIPGVSPGSVGIQDLLFVLSEWGACPPPCPPTCPGDLNNDCVIGIQDLLIVLANWGPCPP